MTSIKLLGTLSFFCVNTFLAIGLLPGEMALGLEFQEVTGPGDPAAASAAAEQDPAKPESAAPASQEPVAKGLPLLAAPADVPTPFDLSGGWIQTMDADAARAEFVEAERAFRQSMKGLIPLRVNLALSDLERGEDSRQAWVDGIYGTNPSRMRMEKATFGLLQATGDKELLPLAFMMFNHAFQNEKMGQVYAMARVLRQYFADHPEGLDKQTRDSIQLRMGLSAAFVGDYPVAKEFVARFQHLAPDLNDVEKDVLNQVIYGEKVWARELERMKTDRDLPRVRLETSLGNVEIELFEDHAPLTVNHFVHLVESGFFDDTLFHEVIPAEAALGGIFDIKRQPRITGPIPDEFSGPVVRPHLYGYINLTRPEQANTATSIFTVLKRPVGAMDGNRTVFARVVSGMDVVEEFETTIKRGKEEKMEEVPGAVPTVLKKAVVIRKRNHEYRSPAAASVPRSNQ